MGSNQPWWLRSLERVSNSSRHSLAISGSNPASGMYKVKILNKKGIMDPLYIPWMCVISMSNLAIVREIAKIITHYITGC